MTVLERLQAYGGNTLGFTLPQQMGLYGSAPKPAAMPASQNMPNTPFSGMFADPFSTAMSGNKSGTLQPFINRNTNLANNALYGGLLGYQPQQLMAGDAGGTPVNPTPPQWKLPSAIPNPNQAQVGLLGPQGGNYNQQEKPIFGNRAWMEY
jgi:hypothetical protein